MPTKELRKIIEMDPQDSQQVFNSDQNDIDSDLVEAK